MPAQSPTNDERRVAALREYGILDTKHEHEFDAIVDLAAKICETPISLITLLDADRQWFKAEVGTGLRETPISASFCVHTIKEGRILEVADTSLDRQFRDNPFVTGDPHVRFYAGAPLTTPEGVALGSLCVIDTRPRELTPLQRETLEVLSRQVMAQLELRRKVRQLEEARETTRERDEFLRIVTDRMPVRVGYIDSELRYVFLNGEYERQFGFRPGEAWGRGVEEIVGPAAFSIAKPHIERALAGDSHTVEFEVPYPQGSRRILADFIADVDRAGTVRGVVTHALDVTERFRTAEALRHSEARYQAIFDSIDEGFCIIDMIFDEAGKPVDYRFVEINPTFERFTGISAEAALSGKTVRELVPGLEEIWYETYGHVALTGEPLRFESGSAAMGRWFNLHASRVGGPGSTQVAVVFTDVTARKKSEEEQARLLAELSAEREKLRAVFEQAPAFLALLHGRELIFEYVNDAYYGLVGHRDILGKKVLDALPEVAGQGFIELLEGVMSTGTPFVGRALPIFLQRSPNAPAEERFVDFVYQPVRDGSGSIYGILAHGIDVTDQVIARKRIAQSEEQFRTVFQNAPDAVLLMDTERCVVAWNPAAQAITGWQPHEIVGLSGDLLFTEEEIAAGVPVAEAETAAAQGKAFDERWHLRKDRTRFWASGTMNALYHSDGTLRGFLKVFRDATERYEFERRIREMNEKLEQRVKERTQELEESVREAEAFNYSISHDLRAPLRAIVSTSSILREDLGEQIDDEYRVLLDRQVHNANRLGRLIDELLRLSRLARTPVNREDLDMSQKARSVAAELDPTRKVEVQEGMTGRGDAALVRTVYENLIGNALKFSPPDSVVRVGKTADAFWVKDEGVGFEMRYATKIFLPFERLVTEAEFEGTGIGLANVERIVRRHGGSVWAESEPGQGATFFFTLGTEG